MQAEILGKQGETWMERGETTAVGKTRQQEQCGGASVQQSHTDDEGDSKGVEIQVSSHAGISGDWEKPNRT